MLREASITYSSVPQDEDSSSQSAFVTTRHANKPHDQRDCHLTAIITSLVIICGVSLAVILPLALQYRSDATGRGEILQHLTGELGNNSKNTDQEGNVNNKLSGPASHTIESNIENSTTKTSMGPAENQENTTKRPIMTEKPTTTTTTTTTATTATTKTPTIAATPPPPAPTIVLNFTIIPSSGAAEKPAGGGKVGTEGIGDAGQASGSSVIVGKGNGSQETPNPPLSNTEAPIKNDTKEAILDAIYGKNDTSSKPTTTQVHSGWLEQVMAQNDAVPLLVMLSLGAVVSAVVIIAITWLVYNRITVRRRRINMQSIITDLQSRDKVVLLNSEESEEE
ncbi:guanine exchange factor for Rac 30-like [Homarus americanus]|uniref:guanine exchange factor for Rac 30-like n=1 Tax=Homarus americanus TaxID=6706 RepID=UPI001C4845BC|nr:guanine exchange factor for Rac 30-like [Homarus americanus]